MFNGQGSMTHASGVLYEGLWINGRPSAMSAKIVITNENPIEIIQGTAFELSIECQNDMGELIPGKCDKSHKPWAPFTNMD